MASRIRLTPTARREQLLDLGTRMLAVHGLDDLSIDVLAEEAGISRGLLYHYFDSLQGYHQAVIERAAHELVQATAPIDSADPFERLLASMEAYVDYVTANLVGYRSLIQAASGGDPVIKALYDEARGQMLERMFAESTPGAVTEYGFADTPATRLIVHGWMSMAETMVIAWVEDPQGIERAALLSMLLGALPGALSGATSAPAR